MTTQLAKFFENRVERFFEPDDLLFKNFFELNSLFLPAINVNTKYPVDIHETEDALNIEIAVAGIEKKDINIEEEDGVLKVSYSKQEEIDKEQEGRYYIHRGIARRAFSFGWKISDKYDLKNIDATMDKGILKIEIPKSEEKPVIKNTIQIK